MEHDADHLPRQPIARRGPLFLPVCALLAASLLWLPMLYHLQQKRAGDLAQARRDATNMSIALAEQVSRLIEGADQMLQLMQADFARDPQRFDLDGWVKRSGSLRAIANQIAVFDAQGDLVLSMRADVAGKRVNVADRPAFAHFKSHADAGLFVGTTYPSRIQRAMVLPLVRRLNGPDDAFAGVISISLDPEYLARHFQALDIGRDGIVALIGRDGYIRARSPSVAGMYTRNMREDPARADIFKALERSTAQTHDLTSAFDGKTRIYTYRNVSALPLVIAVGLSTEEVLAASRGELARMAAIGIGVTAVIVLLLALLMREQQRRQAREQALASSHAALAEAEAGFRGIFESSPDILCVHRIAPDGSILVDALNPAARASRNITADACGQRLADVLPAPLYAEARRRIEQVVASGKMLRLHDEGSIEAGRDCEIVMVPLFADGGDRRVGRVVVSIRDVSHLRRAECAVARSEARFRLLAESTGDMITRLNLHDFSREYVSPGCRGLLGYEPAEMLGKVPSDAMHPEDAPRVRAQTRALVSGDGDEEVTATYRVRHKLGHWVWVEGRVSLARDGSGTPIAIVCSLRDVTERLKAEAAVRASETRFRLLAENTSELIVLGKQDGTRTYISPASRRLFGYGPEELAGEMLSQRWVHPDDRDLLAEATLGDDAATSVICRVGHKGGAWIWVEAIIRRFATASADEPSIIATFRDVSERQAQAQALQRAKEAAEQASQAKTDFLAAMSHEIRTPLNAVLGYADLLLADTGLTGDRRVSLERIQNAGSALRTVVDDILDFSKIEAGEIDLVSRPFHPGALVDNATSIVRGSAQAKGLDLIVDLGPDVPASLLGDHDRLRQILLNLLNNAIKFTPAGAVTLSIRSLRRDAGTVRLRFGVADTGIGIPGEKIDRLFQRFSQVDGSISREFGGTGLGLAICRRLVEAMGGAVGVSSEVGRGSAFWFDVALPVAASGAVAAGGRIEVPTDRAMAVLLVEDQPLNRDLARAVLESAGHLVVSVDNGAAAITAVLAQTFDVVLMDVQMPVMDGIEATKQIRLLKDPASRVPIIAMTANVLPVQVAALRAAGMDDHVGKPFRREDLLASVARRGGPDREAGRGAVAALRSALDVKTFHDLEAIIGQASIRRILAETLEQVAAILAIADREACAARAHGLLAAAGTVGLPGLACALRELERACSTGAPVAAALDDVERSLAQARRAVASCAGSTTAAA